MKVENKFIISKFQKIEIITILEINALVTHIAKKSLVKAKEVVAYSCSSAN
jgi:hypothetical protein